MPASFAIPYFEVEMVIGAIMRRDVRDIAHVLFNLFPRVPQTATTILMRFMKRNPARVRHTSWGGQAVPVERGEVSEKPAKPAVLKVQDNITFEDVLLFQAAADVLASNGGMVPRGGLGAVKIAEAQQRIDELAADLSDDVAEERHQLMIGACQGNVDFLVYDAETPRQVSYGLTNIVDPADFADPNTLVVDEMQKAIRAFRNNNPRGVSPTHVLYSPDFSDYLAGNDQWQEFLKLVPSMAQGFMRVPGGLNPFDLASGKIEPGLFGLIWVPVEGTYNKRNGDNSLTPTARWTKNKITFLNVSYLQSQWRMVVHPWINPEAAINVEVGEPKKGEAVKEAPVIAFENGLPYFRDTSMIQPWTVSPTP